ncbi:glycosyl hydrolase family 76 [Chitinophaga costaii]|nr:glycosyl hydrolase family 76 [Chitinophaga costaii]
MIKSNHIMKRLHLLTLAFAGLLLQACEKNYDNVDLGDGSSKVKYAIDWNAAADSSSSWLINNFYNAGSAYFNNTNTSDITFNYWPQAHALDVLVDAYTRSDSSYYLTYIQQWHDGVKAQNGGSFLNNFYDDMEWNALAVLRAYNATNDARYKTAVDQIWADVKNGWNETMGGGIAWRKSQTYYKNTPANMPACILAARLYRQFHNNDDLDWAKKIYNWEKSKLYNATNGQVYDGINGDNDGKTNTTWVFTYNQGTFIGAALELYNATQEAGYLNDAVQAADFVLNSQLTTADRLLADEGTGDGGLFKGVLVRYMTQLILNSATPDDHRQQYIALLKNNAETLWYTGANKQAGLYGSYWKTPAGSQSDLTTELSGCMMVEAAALLQKNKLL